MLTDSITHVLNVSLQYIALILALLLYEWVKEEYMYLRYRHRERAKRSRQAATEKRLRVLYQYYRDLRRELSLSQEQMAARMGVDPRTIQRWESGEVRPQPRHYSMLQELKYESKIGYSANRVGTDEYPRSYTRASPHDLPNSRKIQSPSMPPYCIPLNRRLKRLHMPPERAYYNPWPLILWIAITTAVALYLILHFWLHLM